MGVLMEPIEKHGAGDLVCACYDVVDRRSTSPSDRHCTVNRMCRVVEEQFLLFRCIRDSEFDAAKREQ